MLRVKLSAIALAVAVVVLPISASGGSERSINASFRLAISNLAAGRAGEALPLLRGILSRQPSLIRVRLELARAFFDLKEYQKAREQFLMVLSSDELPTGVRNTVYQFLRRIDEERGFESDLRFALVAPTGAYRSYDSDTVSLNILGKPLPFKLARTNPPKTALELEWTGRKQWRARTQLFGTGTSVYLEGRGLAQKTSNKEFDRQEVEVDAGVQLTMGNRRTFAETLGIATWYGGRFHASRSGLKFGMQSRSTSGMVLSTGISVSNVSYSRENNRDGKLISAEFGLSRPFGGLGSAGFNLGLNVYHAAREDFGYRDFDARFFHYYEASGGVSLASSIYLKLVEQMAATPGLANVRHEVGYGLDFHIVKNDLFVAKRYTPYAKFGLHRMESSVEAFSYSDANFQIGLSSAF